MGKMKGATANRNEEAIRKAEERRQRAEDAQLMRIQEDEKYGFADESGKVVIPCEWDYAFCFSEGLAKVTDADGKCGFIDKTGKVVIPCQWEDAWSFSEGLAQVKDADGQWWIIDKTGKVVKKVE